MGNNSYGLSGNFCNTVSTYSGLRAGDGVDETEAYVDRSLRKIPVLRDRETSNHASFSEVQYVCCMNAIFIDSCDTTCNKLAELKTMVHIDGNTHHPHWNTVCV